MSTRDWTDEGLSEGAAGEHRALGRVSIASGAEAEARAEHARLGHAGVEARLDQLALDREAQAQAEAEHAFWSLFEGDYPSAQRALIRRGRADLARQLVDDDHAHTAAWWLACLRAV